MSSQGSFVLFDWDTRPSSSTSGRAILCSVSHLPSFHAHCRRHSYLMVVAWRALCPYRADTEKRGTKMWLANSCLLYANACVCMFNFGLLIVSQHNLPMQIQNMFGLDIAVRPCTLSTKQIFVNCPGHQIVVRDLSNMFTSLPYICEHN